RTHPLFDLFQSVSLKYTIQKKRSLLPKYGLSCEDVFIISKLAPLGHGTRTEYIDLYLVHWPGVEGLHPGDSRHSEYRAQSWATLEFYASRQFRAIGVSNYNAKHIRELLMSCRVPPVVLQIECQPKLIQRELRDLCIETGIHFQAYSSLGTGALLREPEVMDIVRSCGRTPAQVLLRWAVQQGISNAQVFDFQLSEMDIMRSDALNCGNKVL
uniref:Zgc:110782 n=1 Tax=Sinocyclocheilus anshuiensis TaxID=1608454 RepID=A0A671SA72_9TELE